MKYVKIVEIYKNIVYNYTHIHAFMQRETEGDKMKKIIS